MMQSVGQAGLTNTLHPHPEVSRKAQRNEAQQQPEATPEQPNRAFWESCSIEAGTSPSHGSFCPPGNGEGRIGTNRDAHRHAHGVRHAVAPAHRATGESQAELFDSSRFPLPAASLRQPGSGQSAQCSQDAPLREVVVRLIGVNDYSGCVSPRVRQGPLPHSTKERQAADAAHPTHWLVVCVRACVGPLLVKQQPARQGGVTCVVLAGSSRKPLVSDSP